RLHLVPPARRAVGRSRYAGVSRPIRAGPARSGSAPAGGRIDTRAPGSGRVAHAVTRPRDREGGAPPVAVPPTPPGEVPAADPAGLSEADRGLLRAGVHPDPHRLFGARPADGGTVFRALKPAATHVAVRTATEVFALGDHGDGVFAAWAPVPVPDDYRLVVTYPGARTFVVADGYRMPPTVGADDL